MTANSRTGGASMWFESAAQQLKGRCLAVEENQKLRYCIAGQYELVERLNNIFQKLVVYYGVSLESGYPLCLQSKLRLKFWDFSSTADEDIFADQLAKLARLRLEMKHQMAPSTHRTMDVDWGLSRGTMEVKRHPGIADCVVLKMHCSTIVPFQLEVATRAYWRFCCLEHGELLDKGVVNVSVRNTSGNSCIIIETASLMLVYG
ncbi:hypothetical protein DVH05_000634 [Phytophthora capsici]|nr:hypothetical protein DVH05_000634 [Phytophthora capsici]